MEEKFRNLIEHSIFIALLTEPAIRSEWVKKEIAYAINLKKQLILLKERSLIIDTDYQWTEFDRNASSEELLRIVIDAIRKVKNNQNLLNPETQKLLITALLSFLTGWLV